MYKFGFNGQLKDNEIYGEGNAYSFEYRIQDPRLVRFLSVDPLRKNYPHYTPYSFAGNSPILFLDLEGLEEKLPWYLSENKHGGKPVLTLGIPSFREYKRIDYSASETPSESYGIFVWNTIGSAWNNIARTWNQGREGKTGAQIFGESLEALEDVKIDDFKKIETYENLAGTALTIYVTKRIVNPSAKNNIPKAAETVKTGLELESSVAKAVDKSYKAMGEVTVPIKNTGLLNSLNAASKGDWVKVYEAGLLNGTKIETHYFRNNTTGQVFDVKPKYDYWHQKEFKSIGE